MKRLSDLQVRALSVLSDFDPPWTLTGGGALAGFHLGHRTTRDIDLFWHGRASIADLWRDVVARLRRAGFEVTELRAGEAFGSLRVTDGDATVVVDLVADPVPTIEAPARLPLPDGHTILVDTPHEVLVNKLCALLHRSELRDLLDVEALVASGCDLDRGLADAPRKDGGFSALTLGFTLGSWPIAEIAAAAGYAERASDLEQFRALLVRRAASRDEG